MSPDWVLGVVMLVVGVIAVTLLARERRSWPALLLGVLVLLQGARYVSVSALPDGSLRLVVSAVFGAVGLGIAIYLYLETRSPRSGEATADRGS